MNFNLYKIIKQVLIKSFLIAVLLFFQADNTFSNLLEKKSHNNDEQFNEDLFKEILKGAGFNSEDSFLAVQSFKRAFPPERLTESSYIILPFIDKSMNAFAVSIDGSEAVLVKKINGKFRTFITSSRYAHKILEQGFDEVANNENLLEIENNFKNKVKINPTLSEEEITFKKGDSLINILYSPNSNRNQISKIVEAFGVYFNPKKIKINTKGKVVRINKSKILGFYIMLSSKNSILAYISPNGYKAIKVSTKFVDKKLYEKINSYLRINEEINQTSISLLNDPELKKKEIKIDKGSNLFEVLKREKVPQRKIGSLLNSLKNIYNPKMIRPEQEISLAFKNEDFFGMSIEINYLKEIQVIKTNDGFKEYVYKRPFKKILLFKKIEIKKSLYVDSLDVGLPLEILIDMVKLFSYSIDFQRDIRKSNNFYVYYEFLKNYKGDMIMPGNIIYALAELKNSSTEMFRYEGKSNEHKYFDFEGKSIRKTLMKTPIDGARLSSGFGKRMHPVLGYSKMHKGVDFAAKKGTPVYAAGDGIIERANNYGAYGKYIRIRHNSEYKTAYAHLNKFARKVKKGFSVKQGQTIGYVGSTGRSTGPHLHYEIILNGNQINPQKLKLPEKKKIDKAELQDFKLERDNILSKISEYINFNYR